MAKAKNPRTRRIIQLDDLDIQLRPLTKLGFEPKTAVVGISSEGTVGPMVASQLIQQLDMDQVCAIESPMFPPTSMVYFRKPKFPARIYASKEHRLVVILAEFAPMDELVRPLTYALLEWCTDHKVPRIIGIDSFAAEMSSPAGVVAAAIGATARDRKALSKAKVSEVEHGSVTGVAGVLLNEGRWEDRDTIVLMASVGEGPNSQAAWNVLALLRRLLPGLPLKVPARQPTELEKAIRAAHQRSLSHEFI